MAREVHGMVEKRGAGLWLTHVFMILVVLVIFFPIWLAFVASTVTQPEIVKPPMPLWPGDQLWENYSKAVILGCERACDDDADQQSDHGNWHCGWQDHHLAAVSLRHRLFPLSGAKHVLLDDLPDTDVAC